MADPPQAAPEDAPEDKGLTVSQPPELLGNLDHLEEVEIPDQAPGSQFSNEEHRARATKLLALLLFAALISSFVAHLIYIVCLAHDKPNSVEEVSRVFNTWIPVFSGLFGSAATFYFTQGRK